MAQPGLTVEVPIRVENGQQYAKYLRQGETVLYCNHAATVTDAEFVWVDDVRMVKVSLQVYEYANSPTVRGEEIIVNDDALFHTLHVVQKEW